MNYAQIIEFLYPSAIVENDFSILINGSNISITQWNAEKLGPQPPLSELESAWPDAQLASIKTTQRTNIKEAFTLAANAPITDANGITWEGSKESGTSIFLGCQLAQQAGATMITVFDAAKEPHQMTITEGMAVAALIGMQYQTVLAKKNALYAQIDAAKTVDDVQTVVWE